MQTYITYSPNGDGCYLQIGEFNDLQLAIDATPIGGKVEILTEFGSSTIYP